MDIIRGALAIGHDLLEAYDHFNSFHDGPRIRPQDRPQPAFTPETHQILDATVGPNHRDDNARRYCVQSYFRASGANSAEMLWYMQRWGTVAQTPGVDYTRNPYARTVSSRLSDEMGMPPMGQGSAEQTMVGVVGCLLGMRYCGQYDKILSIIVDYEVRFGRRESTYAMMARQIPVLEIEVAPPCTWFPHTRLIPICTSAAPLR